MSDLDLLLYRAEEIRQKYDEQAVKNGRAAWQAKDYALGFVTDVGDLMKLVLAKENVREVDDIDAKLKHELSDCLWSILILANQYDIDLEKEFGNAMADIERKIDV